MTGGCFPTGGGKLSHAKRLMPRAGVGAAHLRCEHQLICRKGESANVKRVGLDNRSADQKIMTDVFFGGSDVNESISLITRVYNALLKAMSMR